MILHRKSFYLLRHGQSTDNALGLISGAGSDCDLTDLGREQAKAAAGIYMALPVKPAHIVASGLKRTHQTARIILGHSDFSTDPRFNERHLGELDGKITEDEQRLRLALPGEESANDHSLRVHAALNEYLAEYDSLLVICHGGTIRRILETSGLKNKAVVNNAVLFQISPGDNGWDIAPLN